VAPGVVHLLEVVDVQADEGERVTVARRLGHGDFAELVEGAAVAHLRELIGARLPLGRGARNLQLVGELV
jgi:hypothetical protein